VLNLVVGGVVALGLFGLPLAIIGLFIASILDRRSLKTGTAFQAESRKRSPEMLGAFLDRMLGRYLKHVG
jgi:hypothetical protein